MALLAPQKKVFYFDQFLGVSSTQKLVKIHNNYVFFELESNINFVSKQKNINSSSLHWLFDCFLCRFHSSGVYSECTSPLDLHQSLICVLSNIGIYGLTHLRSGGGGANICDPS